MEWKHSENSLRTHPHFSSVQRVSKIEKQRLDTAVFRMLSLVQFTFDALFFSSISLCTAKSKDANEQERERECQQMKLHDNALTFPYCYVLTYSPSFYHLCSFSLSFFAYKYICANGRETNETLCLAHLKKKHSMRE